MRLPNSRSGERWDGCRLNCWATTTLPVMSIFWCTMSPVKRYLRIPLAVGAVVINVETLLNVGAALGISR